MIAENAAEVALNELQQTDDKAAVLKGAVETQLYILKKIRAYEFLQQSGSVEARKSSVEQTGAVAKAADDYHAALVEFEKLSNKRKSLVLTIDIWRSTNANKRMG